MQDEQIKLLQEQIQALKDLIVIQTQLIQTLQNRPAIQYVPYQVQPYQYPYQLPYVNPIQYPYYYTVTCNTGMNTLSRQATQDASIQGLCRQ